MLFLLKAAALYGLYFPLFRAATLLWYENLMSVCTRLARFPGTQHPRQEHSPLQGRRPAKTLGVPRCCIALGVLQAPPRSFQHLRIPLSRKLVNWNCPVLCASTAIHSVVQRLEDLRNGGRFWNAPHWGCAFQAQQWGPTHKKPSKHLIPQATTLSLEGCFNWASTRTPLPEPPLRSPWTRKPAA